jgi:hypothetical protein
MGRPWRAGRCPAGLADAGEVAFHVCREDRYTDAAECFRDDLEGHRLAGAGGARHKAVTVGKAGQQHQIGLGVGLLCDQHRFGHSVVLFPGFSRARLEVTPVPWPVHAVATFQF